jgi:hypothetical protein
MKKSIIELIILLYSFIGVDIIIAFVHKYPNPKSSCISSFFSY